MMTKFLAECFWSRSTGWLISIRDMDAPVHVRIVPRDTIIIVTGWIVVPTSMPRTRIGTQKYNRGHSCGRMLESLTSSFKQMRH